MPDANPQGVNDSSTIEVVIPESAPWVQIPVWTLGLGPLAFAIFGSLMSFANNETKKARPSVSRVAKRAHVSESTAHRCLHLLEGMGALVITRLEREDGGSFVNRYDLRPAFDPSWGGALDAMKADPFGGGVSDRHPPLSEGHRGGVSVTPELEVEELEGASPPSLQGLELAAAGTAHPEPSRTSGPTRGENHATALCLELREAMIANGCRPPTITKAWLDAARLLVDKDGIDPADVSAAIKWATNHSFWKANILSMTKLRDKYDRLRLQSIEENRRAPSPSYDSAMASLAEMAGA